MKRGKRSAADIEITTGRTVDVVHRMPEPPAELNDAQRMIWRDAVASMKGDWLVRGAYPLLIEYTRRVCRSRVLEAQVQKFETEWLRVEGGLERFDKLLQMADREARGVVALARSLRLTPHARMHPSTAARRTDIGDGSRPW